MSKSEHRLDLGFIEDERYGGGKYRPFDVLATRKNRPVMVMCSEDADPPRWQIVGDGAFSVHFLSYADMEDYIIENELTRWTKAHEAKTGIHLSATNASHPIIY